MRRLLGGALVLVALVVPACGKRGDPRPPLRRTPQPLGQFKVAQRGARLEVSGVAPRSSTEGVALATMTVELLRADGDGDFLKLAKKRAFTVQAGETFTDVELRLRTAKGEERLVSINGAPVRNSAGQIILGEIVVHDTDVVVNATGFRPNLDILREIRLELDEIVEAPKRLAPLIDPNVHSCGTVEPHGFRELTHPEQGFFIVGMKSYGRAPTFLLATGYEQVRSVTAWLAGDAVSASNVELVLPATGVCSSDLGDGASSCCS